MRKLLVGLLALALVVVGALLPLVMPRRCQVSRAACKRIQEGMTQAEVHATLGGPPGDYRTRPGPSLFFSRYRSGPYRLIEEWEGDEGLLIVDYHPRPAGPRP